MKKPKKKLSSAKKALRKKNKQLKKENKELRLKMLHDKIDENAVAAKHHVEQAEKSFERVAKQNEKALERTMRIYLAIALVFIAICSFVLDYVGRNQINQEVGQALERDAKAKIDSLLVKVGQKTDTLFKEKGEMLLAQVRAEIKKKGDSAIHSATADMQIQYVRLIASLKNKKLDPAIPVSDIARKDLDHATKILPKIKNEADYSFDDWFYKGVAEYENKKYTDALNSLTHALNKNPDSPEAYTYRSRVYIGLQLYEKGIADCNAAISINPRFTEAYNARGICQKKLMHYDQAMADYEKGKSLDPLYARNYYDMGNIYDTLGQPQNAIAEYKKAIELKPDYYHAYNRLGIIYHDLKEHEEAIINYTKAIQIKPDYAIAYLNRGISYQALNQIDKANGDYIVARKLEPEKLSYVLPVSKP